ncbi:hypothetical protein OAE43_00940 [Akkermansiaceae bacterium]|nr:hypothetical protein [Akkermansiaceae bacterium]
MTYGKSKALAEKTTGSSKAASRISSKSAPSQRPTADPGMKQMGIGRIAKPGLAKKAEAKKGTISGKPASEYNKSSKKEKEAADKRSSDKMAGKLVPVKKATKKPYNL